MSHPEKLLRLLLQLTAALLMLAFIPVFFPFAWMAAIHDRLGIGTLPDLPIIGYLARSASLLYGTMGLFYLVVSFDLPRYAPLIYYSCWLKIGLGATMIVLDVVEGMPLLWLLSEGPWIIVIGVVLLWLLRRWEDTIAEPEA